MQSTESRAPVWRYQFLSELVEALSKWQVPTTPDSNRVEVRKEGKVQGMSYRDIKCRISEPEGWHICQYILTPQKQLLIGVPKRRKGLFFDSIQVDFEPENIDKLFNRHDRQCENRSAGVDGWYLCNRDDREDGTCTNLSSRIRHEVSNLCAMQGHE
jgi:hypothetical protein